MPSFMMLPFGVFLALIALGPLCFAGFWSRHHPKVACGLALLVIAYYFVALH